MTEWIRNWMLWSTVLIGAAPVRAQHVSERVSQGNSAVQAARYDEALQAFQEALAGVEPGSPEAGDLQLRIGETYRRKGDLTAAVASLSRARELLPGSPVVTGTLALALDLTGKFPEAEAAYRATLELDPDNAIAMNNLAYLLAMHGGPLEEALGLAGQAHRMAADSADFSDTLAVVKMRMGDFATARAILMDLVRREPGDEGFRRHLAAVLEQEPWRKRADQELLDALRGVGVSENTQRVADIVSRMK